jgi:MFS transporter, OFA family, oxalate/formate antiporter
MFLPSYRGESFFLHLDKGEEAVLWCLRPQPFIRQPNFYFCSYRAVNKGDDLVRPQFKTQRYIILLGAVALQLCLGATYSWSVFVKPLRDLSGLSQATAQLPFSVFYFSFPLTVLFSAKAVRKLGPAGAAAAGGILFGFGWILASLGSASYAFTVAGVGLFAGIGVGLAYVVPLSVLVRWFPNQKGLVAGIAVAGFGAGAALISQTAGFLISTLGYTPYAAFGLLGSAFLLIASGSGLLMKLPRGISNQHIPLLPHREVLSRSEFRLLYIVMIVALASGFSVNANMKELFPAGGMATGILGVSFFAVANAVGRMVWGGIFDRSSASISLRANLIAQAIVLLSSPWLLTSRGGFLTFAVAAGFNYGGVLVLYAATVTQVWGAEHVGQVYGMLFSANIVAAPAPLLAGLWYDATNNFTWFFLFGAALLIWSALMLSRRGNSQLGLLKKHHLIDIREHQ